MTRVVKIDLTFSEHLLALVWIPSEIANVRERPLQIFRHSETPQSWVAILLYRPRVRYDGIEVLAIPPQKGRHFDRTLVVVYIQTYAFSVKEKRRRLPL